MKQEMKLDKSRVSVGLLLGAVALIGTFAASLVSGLAEARGLGALGVIEEKIELGLHGGFSKCYPSEDTSPQPMPGPVFGCIGLRPVLNTEVVLKRQRGAEMGWQRAVFQGEWSQEKEGFLFVVRVSHTVEPQYNRYHLTGEIWKEGERLHQVHVTARDLETGLTEIELVGKAFRDGDGMEVIPYLTMGPSVEVYLPEPMPTSTTLPNPVIR